MTSLLWTYQAQANETGEEITLPWAAINQVLKNSGAPSVDVTSFGKNYDSNIGPLQNIVNGDRDSFNRAGIVLKPDSQPNDLVNNQQVVDTEHNTVKKTAMHQLKSKK